MKITGLQKMTLLDFPGRIACTVFLQGCNFRCPFCHNSDLLGPEGEPGICAQELLAFLKKRRGMLDGVCITGGEPLLQPDLEELIREIREMGFLVKLDTNGSFPQKLSHLLEQGLIDYVAMDIKNCLERYQETAGLPEHYDLTPIQDSVRLLIDGNVPYEFRTTIVREYHRPQDVVSMAHWIAGASRYYLQGFIESENVIKSGLHGLNAVEMDALVPLILPYVPSVQVRGV